MVTTASRGERATIVEILGESDALGDREFEAVYHHYIDQLCRFAVAKGAIDPEGVANMALFDAYRAFGRKPIRHEPAFRQYLYRAATNRVIGEHRRPQPTPQELPDNALVVDDWANALVDRQWLSDMVAELPEAQRDVIHDRFFADLTVSESATRQGRKNGAVHQLQHRAVRRLRRILLTGAAAAAVVVIAFVAWRMLSDDGNRLDTGPAGTTTPSTTSVPPTTSAPTTTSPTTPTTIDDALVPTSIVAPPSPTTAREPSIEGEASSVGPPSTASAIKPPAPDAAGPPVVPNANDDEALVIGADAVSSGESVFKVYTGLAEPATTPDKCRYWVNEDGRFALMLYYPGANEAEAAATVPPSLIRLSDADDQRQLLATSSDVLTGTGLIAAGWLPIGSNDAPAQSFADVEGNAGWTILYEPELSTGWTTVEYLHQMPDGTVMWAIANSCAGESHTVEPGAS